MQASVRTQRYIALLAVVLFLAKLGAYFITHSVTILTDALESIVNVVAGFIGLYSIILSTKPRDADHPYGHGKVEFISAAIEGTLIIIAGLCIIYSAVHRLYYSAVLNKLDVGLYIIAATGLINFLAGRYAVAQGKKNSSMVVSAAGKHLLSDAYSTFAIIVGLCLVLFTHYTWLDSVVAMVFSLIIIVAGYKVLRRSISGIMDEVDTPLVEEVVAFLQHNRKPQWVDMHNLRVIQYGPMLHIDTHMTLPWYYKVEEAEREIHELEDLMKKHYDNRVELFIHIDACKPYQCKLCALQECPVRQEPFKGQLEWNLQNVLVDEKHGKHTA